MQTTPQPITIEAETYTADQAALLQAIDALRAQVVAHGAEACRHGYHYSYHQDLATWQQAVEALLHPEHR